MHWDLLWAALGGLLVGLLGAFTVPGHRGMAWPLGPLLGLGGALGGNALAVTVLGREHLTVNLVVALVIAAIVVFAFAAYLRVRTLA